MRVCVRIRAFTFIALAWCFVVLCRVLCVCVCTENTGKRHEKMNKRSGHMVIIVWARYGQLWTKKSPKTPLFPTQRFYTSLRIYRRFRPKVLFQTAKKMPFWARGPNPKDPNHALEKLPNQRNTQCVPVERTTQATLYFQVFGMWIHVTRLALISCVARKILHAKWEASLLTIPVSVPNALCTGRSPCITRRGTQHHCVASSVSPSSHHTLATVFLRVSTLGNRLSQVLLSFVCAPFLLVSFQPGGVSTQQSVLDLTPSRSSLVTITRRDSYFTHFDSYARLLCLLVFQHFSLAESLESSFSLQYSIANPPSHENAGNLKRFPIFELDPVSSALLSQGKTRGRPC